MIICLPWQIFFEKNIMKITQSLIPIVIALCSVTMAGNQWHTVHKPTKGETKIYGGHANGCFAGGVVIPINGEGFQQVRPSRNRHYGDESLLVFIEEIGRFAKQQDKMIILGDLSQPRGGPMNFGHSSHQTGLDVDIWFESIGSKGLNKQQREGLVTPSLVDAKKGEVSEYWRSYYRDLLYESAKHSKTERIFVNPVIKAHLCETEKNKDWLYKIRPWFGHDSHFHVRLACPKNQPNCIAQAPVAKTSGCDADLKNWVKDQKEIALGIKKTAPSKGAQVSKVLPIQCRAILHE